MPDFDAGTAHGKFKLTSDTRGADKATKAVDQFQRALEFIASRLGAFVGAMDKIESELKTVTRDFKDAEDAADKYDRELLKLDKNTIKASRSTKDFASNVHDLHGRLKVAHDAMADFGLPLIQAVKGMQEFNRAGGGVKGVLAGMAKAGVVGTAIATLKSHFIGLSAALRQAPAWQRNMAVLGQNIGLVTLAGSKLSKVIGPLEKGFGKFIDKVPQATLAVDGFSNLLRKTLIPISEFSAGLDRIPTGLFKMAGGMALTRAGINGLAQRFSLLNGRMAFLNNSFIGRGLKFLFLPGVILSSAAVQAFDKSLQFLSNTFAGLWSGVKQLSGGFLALPGLFATIGAAAIPIVAIAKTIKSNLKDLIKAEDANDAKKFAEAMNQIPPYLRPVAQAIADIYPKIKSFGDVLTATFVGGGLDTQLRALANSWLPAVSNGAVEVANSWKILTTQFAGFLGQAKTISATNTIFMHTSQIMNTIAGSVQPVLSGFRDIATVGSTFIRNLAEDYLPGIADKFGKWADGAVATGKAMKWMEDSVRAVKDLYKGFDQLIRGTWQLLTLFQTKPGDTFLDRFAASMKKFNDTVTKSKNSGELKKIADSVKSIGTDKLKELWQLFKDLEPAIKAALQTLSQIGNAFGQIMLPVIQAVTAALVPLIQGFNALGLGGVVGTVLGLAKAFSILKFAGGTLLDFLKVGLGIKFFTSGIENIIVGTAGALEKFGSAGRKASDGLLGIGDKISGFVTKAATIIGVVIAAASAFEEADKKQKSFQDTMSEGTKIISDFKGKLLSAFSSDNGLISNNVLSAIDQQLNATVSNLKSTGDKMPGLWDHIVGFFNFTQDHDEQTTWNPLKGIGDPKWINAAQAAAQGAREAQDAINKLGLSNQQLTDKITGGQPAFDSFINDLKNAGDNSGVAQDKFRTMREQILNMQRDMEAVGPAGIKLADAIQKIAHAAGDTNTKLDALKQALEALGILQTNQYEAAANYAKAVEGLGDAARSAVDPSQKLDDILTASGDHINVWSKNGINLINVLQPMGEAFLKASAAGQDANALWNDPKFQDQIAQVAAAFHLTTEQVKVLIQQFGAVPDVISVLVQLDGKDKVAQDLAEIIAQVSHAADRGVEIPIKIQDPHGISNLINTALGGAVTRATDNILYIEPTLDNSKLEVLKTLLAQHGISIDHAPIPGGSDPQLPIVPGLPNVTPGGTGSTQDPFALVPGLNLGLLPAIPAPVTTPVPQPNGPAPGPTIPQPGTPPTDPSTPKPGAAPKGPPPSGYKLPPGLPPPLGYVPPTAKTTPGQVAKPVDPNTQLPAGTYLPPGMTGSLFPAPLDTAPAAPVSPAAPIAPLPVPQGAPQGQISGFPSPDQFGAIQGKLKELLDDLKTNLAAWTDWNNQITTMLAKIPDQFNAIITKLNDLGNKAKDAGKNFTQQFAAGLMDPDAIARVNAAAAKVAQAAADYTHQHSPAKKGPLSGSGWSGQAGENYSTQFAQGIVGQQNAVGEAASKVAGKARGALAPATPYGQFGFKFAGDGLDRIKSVLSVVNNAVSAFKSIGDQAINVGKFLADPFGQSGKGAGGKNGPGAIGGIFSGGAAALRGNAKPSKEDIAAAIGGEAQKRGYDRNTAIGVISAAMQESGLDPNQVNASGHQSLFQTSADKGVGLNAGDQIAWMFNQLDQLGGPNAAGLKSDPLDFIASQIERGGYGGAALGQHSLAASKLYDQALAGAGSGGVGPWAGVGGLQNNPASAASHLPQANDIESAIKASGGLPRLYNGTDVPPWMQQLAQAFGLTASTYGDGGSLHQMGFAADFNSPTGNKADLERFAQYIQGNLSGQTLQLIHQGQSGTKYGIAGGQNVGPGTSQPGYYAADFGGHSDHVHWATDVAPILANANASSMPFAAGTTPFQQTGYGQNNPIDPGASQGIFGGSPEDPNSKYLGQPGQQQQNANFAGFSSQGGVQSTTTSSMFDTISKAGSAAGNIASDVLGTLQAGVDAWGATKYLADQAVRGISDTEDIFNSVDQVQKYITFAAKIAQTTGDALGQISGLVGAGGAGDPSGASAGISMVLGMASQIAQFISEGLQTANAIIDLGQEVYRVAGTFIGPILGRLAGNGSQLMGDVHYLLDQNTGQLVNYSSDNPNLKYYHNVPGQVANPSATNQAIGQLNYFAGPGQDPRDSTRQMLYQVKANQLTGATNQ